MQTPIMKTAYRWALLAGVALAVSTPAAAQEAEDVAAQFSAALSAGAVEGVEELLADRVQLGVLGSARSYSRPQALLVLRDFLRDHPAATVQWQDRKAVADSWYGIAQYRARSGTTFLVSMLLGRRPTGWRIEELVVREAD